MKNNFIVAILLISIVLFCGCGRVERKEDSNSSRKDFTISYEIVTDEETLEDSSQSSSLREETSKVDSKKNNSKTEVLEGDSSKKEETKRKTDDNSFCEVNSFRGDTDNSSNNSICDSSSTCTKEVKDEIGPVPIDKIPTRDEDTVGIVGAYGPVQPEEKISIVYKPSTHYLHKSNCHWVTDECYEITNTDNIEARICTECNPDIVVVNEYVEPTITYGIDSYSRQLLAEITWHEAGSNWISLYEKARICAGVMNRVNDYRFPNTVYSVLTQSGQFTGYWPGCCYPTQACYDAVDYYFAHPYEFGNENSWWGDGVANHFYHQ